MDTMVRLRGNIKLEKHELNRGCLGIQVGTASNEPTHL